MQTVARELQGNLTKFTLRTDSTQELAEFGEESKEDYNRRLLAFYGPGNIPTSRAPPKAITGPGETSEEVTQTKQELVKVQTELAKIEHELSIAKRKLKISADGGHAEPPFKPNALKPYPASQVGFERARRDCRWEMIKIVKEVDEVAKDPQVAIDPNRIGVYLSPTIFRELLPASKPLPPYTQTWVDNELESWKTNLAAAQADLESKKTELASTKTTLAASEQNLATEKVKNSSLQTAGERKDQDIARLQTQVSALNTTNEAVAAVRTQLTQLSNASSTVQTTEKLTTMQTSLNSLIQANDEIKKSQQTLAASAVGSRSGVQRWGIMVPSNGVDRANLTARYNFVYSTTPAVLTAISELRGTATNTSTLRAPTLKCNAPVLGKSGVDLVLTSFPYEYTDIENCDISWMTSPSGILECGVVMGDGYVTDNTPNQCGTMPVTFSKPYSTPPRVAVFALTFSWAHSNGSQPQARTRLYASDITTTGFNIRSDVWGGSAHEGANVSWCAWDASIDNLKVVKGTKIWGTQDLTGNNSATKGGTLFWEADFAGRQPVAILTGITAVDVDISVTKRFHVECKVVGDLGPKTLLRYGPDSSTQTRWCEVGYVAILQD